MLAFLAALKGIANSQVELRGVVYVVGGELARLKDRQKLCVGGKHGIGTKIRGSFEGLVLQDGGASRLESVVVLEGQANSLVQRYAHGRSLRGGLSGSRGRGSRGVLVGR